MKKNKIIDILQNEIIDIYSCTRVWSAWSYGTMSLDDFVPVNEDEEVLNEIADQILDLKNISIDSISSVLENYQFFYNDNIEDNFESHLFHEDIFEHIDLEKITQDISILKNKEKHRIKLK